MNAGHSALLIGAAALATLFTRALPFWVFSGKGGLPPRMQYLGKVLPFTVITILVLYCVRAVQPLHFPFGLPELLCIVVVAVLHVWKRNNLLSIGVGTVLYMAIVQNM